MANLNIVDSGFINSLREGSKAATASLVNSGVRIPLFATVSKWRRGLNADDAPYPGQAALSDLNPSSVTNPTITVKGIIDRNGTFDRDDDGGSDNQVLMLSLLDSLCSGTAYANVKCLYYSKIVSGETYTEATDAYLGLIKSLGESNKGDAHSAAEVPASTPHLHVHVTGFEASQMDSKGMIPYTLTLQLTK